MPRAVFSRSLRTHAEIYFVRATLPDACLISLLDDQVTYRYWSDYKKVYVDKWLRVEVIHGRPHIVSATHTFVVTRNIDSNSERESVRDGSSPR